MTYSTYSNQNSFGYQANSFSNYYQKEAIAQREKQVTDYLDFIADSRINNQSQHDTLVALGTLIYDLREVYIIQDANQNRFYDDNKYLEFVNRQLTAFKDRVLVNYQHYLNLAPSFAPQYLEQNITILHELSHGQYSPIRRLNLEHQPIYSFDYYGQAQATFFSTQQQQNLETMMSYRPGIWTPAPPPVSLFSIAGYSNYHDPYNFYSSNPAKSHSYSPSVVKSQGSPENYFVSGGSIHGDGNRAQASFLSFDKSQAQVLSNQESNAGGVLKDEFEDEFDSISNSYQTSQSSVSQHHFSPLLSQEEKSHKESINEPGNHSPSQLPHQQFDLRGDSSGLSQKVAEGRDLLKQTESIYLEEVEGSDGDNPLPRPTTNFADQYTSDKKAYPRVEFTNEERRQSTSPVSSEDEGEVFNEALVAEEQGAGGAMEIAPWNSVDQFSSIDQGSGGDSLASGPRLLRRQGRPFLQGSDGNDLVVVTRSSPFQGAHAEGQSFGNRQNSDYIVTFYNGNAPHRSRLQGIPEEDYSVDPSRSQVTSDVSQTRPARDNLRGDLVFAREYSQGGPGNTRRLRSEVRGMNYSETGSKKMDVPSDLRVDRRSLDEATATAELVFASDPVAISERPAVRSFKDDDNPQGRSNEDSFIDRRPIRFNDARSKFLLGGNPTAISLGGSQTTTRYPV